MHFIQGLCVAALASIALHSVTFAADIHKTADLSVHSHTVVAGDTLWDLSEKYLGDPLTYPQVKQANQIDNEHALQPGQELKFITARFYPGVVTGITGQVYTLVGSKKNPLRQGALVQRGSVIQALGQSFVKVQFMNQVEVEISPNSVVLFHAAKSNTSTQSIPQLELQQGSAEFQVPPVQSDYNKLEVRTPYLTLGVRGTHFRVKQAEQTVLSEVLSGQVVLSQQQHELAQVSAGEGAVFNAHTQTLMHEKIASAPRLKTAQHTTQGLHLELEDSQAAAYQVKIYSGADSKVPQHELSSREPRFLIPAHFANAGLYFIAVTRVSPSGLESYPLLYQHELDKVAVRTLERGVEFTFPNCHTQWRVQMAQSQDFLIPVVDRTESNVCKMSIQNLPAVNWHWRVFAAGHNEIEIAQGQVEIIEQQAK
ncbi:FecR family protein [Thiopseudomonas alkaliphila]|uniref:FecR family protein n=1 Tax=Thiopseudomonas alkaliphila TaxID=1697053 RepID=UPI0025779DAB|nr:FecR domain-containing protein [Thiopseudomonas alkaliphila]MDM1707185.1 FecR domain-containing protein [Thiopseudomonas alkaliphila]